MEAFAGPSRQVNQFYGVYPAIVIDNVDPDKRYRVKVKFPWLMESDDKYVDKTDKEDFPSAWCRILSPLMGTQNHEGNTTDKLRGMFFLPEVDDEVLVVFSFGSFREGVIIGQMENGKDLAFWQNTEDNGVQIAEKNCLRGIRSREGHMLTFVDKGKDDAQKIVLQTLVCDDNVYDQPALGGEAKPKTAIDNDEITIDVPDGSKGTLCFSMDSTDGKENILLTDKEGKLVMQFDTKEERIILYSSKDMVLHAKKNMYIKCESLKIESDKDTEMKAGTTWKQESGKAMDLEAGATMTLKGGPEIHLNP